MRASVSERAKIAILSFSLLCLSLLLTAYSARNPKFAKIGTTVLSEIVSPIHGGIDAVADGASSAWGSYFNLVGLAERNRDLVERVSRLESSQASFEEQRRENERLRALLELNSVSELKGVAASVVASEPSGWVKGIVVNKGTSHGVTEGMAVVHPQGVVGQVVSTGPNFSRVLLMTDHASGVDALVQDGRARGVVEGLGSSSCELKYVAKESVVRVGDVVVTSGMDGVFPKGLIIGSVLRVAPETGTLLQRIDLKPAVDFSKLEEVLIVVGDRQQKGEELEVIKAPLQNGGRGGKK